MLFSIVIPVYNVKEYLRKCVGSILANSFSDYEVLLVDDGSTDGSDLLCDALVEESGGRVRVFHQENQGPGCARNTGIAAAQGEYLFFVDSDDSLISDALERLAAAVERYQADILAFDFFSDDGEGHLQPMSANRGKADAPFTLAKQPEFLLSVPGVWQRIWRRTLFDKGVAFPNRVWYEDICTVTKLFALAEKIVILPERPYCYFSRPGSIMNSRVLPRNREIITAMEDVLGWYQEKGLFDQYQKELCALTVEHVLLVASVRVARIDPKSPILQELSSYVSKRFPDFRKNSYIRQLPRLKRLALYLVCHRCYGLLRLLFRLKDGK